ncbi:MAG TPA: hypothetical protein VH369_13045, partial [Bryobacteraceae bacterium]
DRHPRTKLALGLLQRQWSVRPQPKPSLMFPNLWAPPFSSFVVGASADEQLAPFQQLAPVQQLAR